VHLWVCFDDVVLGWVVGLDCGIDESETMTDALGLELVNDVDADVALTYCEMLAKVNFLEESVDIYLHDLESGLGIDRLSMATHDLVLPVHHDRIVTLV
jgi:hypothetical protein